MARQFVYFAERGTGIGGNQWEWRFQLVYIRVILVITSCKQTWFLLYHLVSVLNKTLKLKLLEAIDVLCMCYVVFTYLS